MRRNTSWPWPSSSRSTSGPTSRSRRPRASRCSAYLIETHGVKQGEVAAGTGLADSTVSEILAGKRKMNVKHIEALARFFKVEPAVFLDE